MSTANSPLAPGTIPASSRPPIMANDSVQYQPADAGLANGHPSHSHETRPAPAPPITANMKKGKAKKPADSSETSKLLAARISQLELDAAGEKDLEAEIEREVKKANRELSSVTAKMNDSQKIDYITKRCSDLYAEMKRHERDNIKNKKKADQLQKEKDSIRNELSKTVGLREKLEKLCRELQKENNKLKNENKTLIDEKARHQNGWDEKYSSILQQLDEHQDEKDNPRKQVIDMEMEDVFYLRFKSFMEQYELRELHFHSQMRTKELEIQYNLARCDREKQNYEKEVARTRQLKNEIITFSNTESDLRQQLNVYVDKFKQVEDTLNNSNDLFLTFRKEMEDMSKKTKRLEKENENHKRKHASMNQNVAKMAEERTRLLNEMDGAKKRETKLSGIIKQMQQQGRGIPQGLAGTVKNGYPEGEGHPNDESDYEDGDEEDEDEDEYDEEAEDDESEGQVYDADTEDEQQPVTLAQAQVSHAQVAQAPASSAPVGSTNGTQ